MATLDDIVSVQIALQTAGVARGDFGTPMIVGRAGPETSIAGLAVYTSYAAAVEDKLAPEMLTALSDCFSQTPRPRQVKVGILPDRLEKHYDIQVQPSSDYTVTIAGVSYTYSSSASATLAEIQAGVVDLFTGTTPHGVTVTAVGSQIQIVHSEAVGVSVSSQFTLVATPVVVDDPDGFGASMTLLTSYDNNWYGLVTVSRDKDMQLAAAEWAEANDKLYITATNAYEVLDPLVSTDLLSQLQSKRYYRTAALYHQRANTEYPDAAWAGRVFTIKPGGETWALKQLASITPSSLTATQKQTVIAKGGNTFEFYQAQIALTNPGRVSAGEWVDVIRFRDWLKDTIQTNLAQMLINRDKVPYTDAGIQLCVTNLRKSLQEGQNVGGIAPDELDATGASVPGFVITYPIAAEIPPTVKASRVLQLGFTARLAGAIHVVEISGALAYEL